MAKEERNDLPRRQKRDTETAVVSRRPSMAHSFNVWMSRKICSNSYSDPTSPLARPQNIKASSESGEWPSRILSWVALSTECSLPFEISENSETTHGHVGSSIV